VLSKYVLSSSRISNLWIKVFFYFLFEKEKLRHLSFHLRSHNDTTYDSTFEIQPRESKKDPCEMRTRMTYEFRAANTEQRASSCHITRLYIRAHVKKDSINAEPT